MIGYLRLSLVTHLKTTPIDQYSLFLKKAIEGGITSVQLREKKQNQTDLLNLAMQIQKILKPLKIPLIINDDAYVAKQVNAKGVHLGQTDMSPLMARKILGPDKIIGWSVESFDDLERANQLDCIDYIAASAVFKSKTKPDCKMLWGLKRLEELIKRSRHPVVAIGGICLDNIVAVFKTGVTGVSVIGAIHDHPNPFQAAKNLSEQIQLFITRTNDERSNHPRP